MGWNAAEACSQDKEHDFVVCMFVQRNFTLKKKKRLYKLHNPEKRVTTGLVDFLHSIVALGCQGELLIAVWCQ